MSWDSARGEGTPPEILLVEDDAALRNLLTSMLCGMGYGVRAVGTIADAIEHVGAAPPDLVMLDLHLPDGSGHHLLETVRAFPRTRFLPVIMMTGLGTRADRLRALGAGVTDFLTKPFDPEELTTRIRALLQLKSFADRLEEAEEVIVALARSIDARDPYTAGHSERVSRYATRLAIRIGLSEAEGAAVQRGGLFHDIGKIAIRDAVLLKPDRLTEAEYEEMKQHPVQGGRLIGHLQTLASTMPVVYHHHERLDGSGYPDGLSGDQIPMVARVTTIADVFDALTTARPYRPAFTFEEALAIMNNEARKGWWDPALLAEFSPLADELGGEAPADAPAAVG